MRVLVADDHPLFREGITSLLEAAGFEVVGLAGDGPEAVEQTLRLRPDLVMMDITMVHMSGLEALRQIKSSRPEVKVVMLTASEDDAHLFEAIRSGAHGYLLKSLGTEGFLASLRALERGEMALTRRTATRLIEGFTTGSHEQDEESKHLTPREMQVLLLMTKGLPNKAIAQGLSIGENTVKYYLKSISRKLGVQNRTEAVAFALRTGLVKPDHPE